MCQTAASGKVISVYAAAPFSIDNLGGVDNIDRVAMVVPLIMTGAEPVRRLVNGSWLLQLTDGYQLTGTNS